MIEHIKNLESLTKDWDSSGAEPIKPEMIEVASKVALFLKDLHLPDATGVYAMHDGNIVLEWSLTSGIIARLEIESEEEAELMVSYDHNAGIPTKFIRFDWVNRGVTVKTKDKFERWDGGHCYLRAIKDHDGYVSLHRFPKRVRPQDIEELGEWSASKS